MHRFVHLLPAVCFCVCAFGISLTGYGQVHWLPETNGTGIEGPQKDSYVIVWRQHPEAEWYQYVITDNEFCFLGCAGDTRDGIVIDTFAVEFNLIPGRFYYWTTRMKLANGDTTAWTVISSFKTGNQKVERLLNIGQNPVYDRQVSLSVDWAADQALQRIELELRDLQGTTIWEGTPIVQRGLPLRQQTLSVDWTHLPSGNYLLELRGYDGQNRLTRFAPQKLLLR